LGFPPFASSPILLLWARIKSRAREKKIKKKKKIKEQRKR
jgi:hypothetical protein